jgi:amino acid adenylation domain-containing protein
VTEGYPLSPQQRHLWLAGGGALATEAVVEVDGDPDPERLRSALARLVERLEVLRTVYLPAPGLTAPLQVVGASGVAWVEAPAGGPVDPAGGPVVQARLWPVEPGRWRLELRLPALACDAAGAGCLVAELAAAYDGEPAGEGEVLQYADVAVWLDELLRDDAAEPGRAFWAGRPAAWDPVPALESRVAGPGPRYGRVELPLDEPARGALAGRWSGDADRASGWLAAAMAVLLWRSSGRDRGALGLGLDGRRFDELRPVVGLLARHVPLAWTLEPGEPFSALAGRLGGAAAECGPWQEYHDWSAAGREGHPLYAVACDPAPVAERRGGRSFRLVHVDAPCDRYRLRLSVAGAACERPALDHDAGAVDERRAEWVAGALAAILAAAAADPSIPVGSLPAVAGAERRCLAGLGRGPGAAGDEELVHERVARWAREAPDRPAVRAGEAVLTYGELHATAVRVASALARLGAAGPDRLVGVYAERSAELVVGLLGVLLAGSGYVPLDPAMPVERLAAQVEDCRPAAVVLGPALAPPEPLAGLPAVRVPPADGPAPASPAAAALPASTAYVIFTSGSTGRPKGVVVEHRHLAAYVAGIGPALDLEPGMSFATVSTVAADLGNTSIFGALCGGGCLHVIDQDLASAPRRLAEYLARHGVDALKIVPSQLAALLASAETLPRRRLVAGGEAFPPDLAQRVLAAAPDLATYNHYGPTETTVGVVAGRVSPGSGPVALGRPMAGVTLAILDERMELLPAGAPGELFVGGTRVARGYLGRPDLTAERFLPDPAGEAGARVYRTGDVARFLPDGRLEFVGRADDQLKIRGFRIEPGEVASALSDLPGVARAHVLALEDVPGERTLAGFVVPERPGAGDPGGLREALRRRLPDFMVPSIVVVVDALPLTANGKVDRGALAGLARRRRQAVAVPPRDSLEMQLLRIWEDLLPGRVIGVTQDFFDVGGHSLLAVRLVAAVQDRLGLDLALYELFEGRTIERLAEALREEPRPWSPLVRIRPGPGRPVFCVHAGGGSVLSYLELSRLLDGDAALYGLESAGLDGDARPGSDLEAMATEYVTAMREVQPEGPYRLVGWCAGAIVAFEIARQLRRAGQEVGPLVSVDGASPLMAGEPPRGDEEGADPDAMLTARFAWHYDLPLSPDDVLAAPESDRLGMVLDAARRSHMVSGAAGAAQIERLLGVYRANMLAIRAYRAVPYDREMVVVKASEAPWIDADRSMGWRRLVPDRLRVVELPGDHHSIMRTPHVEALAGLLNGLLRRNGP